MRTEENPEKRRADALLKQVGRLSVEIVELEFQLQEARRTIKNLKEERECHARKQREGR